MDKKSHVRRKAPMKGALILSSLCSRKKPIYQKIQIRAIYFRNIKMQPPFYFRRKQLRILWYCLLPDYPM